MQVKTVLSLKFSVVLTCICVVPFWILEVPLAMMVQTVLDVAGVGRDCEDDTSHPFFYIAGWISLITLYGVHEILNLLIVCAISLKLFEMANVRAKLFPGLATETRGMSKELNATILMFTVVLFNVVNFIPMCLLEGFSHFNRIQLEYVSADPNVVEFNEIVGVLHELSRETLVIAHSTNFFIYFLKIPSFRQKIIKTFYFRRIEMQF